MRWSITIDPNRRVRSSHPFPLDDSQSYPTEDHPDEAEDTRSITTEPEEFVPDAQPIPFIIPPHPRSPFKAFPMESTAKRDTRSNRFSTAHMED
jgi:hypothetical protein